MIDLADYLHDFDNADSLSNKLKERVFLKTELDVVYSELTNWERNGLLYIKDEESKGTWKKLNYIEYTWICIVSELIVFGFNYTEIKNLKAILFNAIGFQELRQGILDSDKEDFTPAMHKAAALIEKDHNVDEIMKGFSMCVLELCIAEIILFGSDYFFYVFKDIEFPFIPWSEKAIKGYQTVGSYEKMENKIKESHCALSVSNIVFKFVNRNASVDKLTPSILTKQEYTILKMIRKNYKDLKSMNIRFADGKIDRMELTTTKKATAESRIIDYIKKGQYQRITIDTEDGKMVNFENTQKFKL
jgi:hypothetical protein